MNFNFDNPYASKRIPLFARNVVSTSHPLAAQAGLRMMLKGGNAVDAAIAAVKSPMRWRSFPNKTVAA
jgi:gamma-glutamyltranspeptidase/glutathione hydrolase